ncbi:hypothetical protein BDE02_06G247500 [Populus trichocarpa]|nr:hypothetical protein BDE02_06G247500 [Populus trichocarpa]
MHALMEYHYAEVVCTDSMVRRKHRRLNFFQQWLSNFSYEGKLQTGQTSLFPILSTDAFRKMSNVKFLQLNYTKFYGSFKHFPKNLIWLCWHGFSLRSIPNHVCLEKLVVLDLSRSCLVDAWKGKPFLPKLKVLDLRHSQDLIRAPDFSGLPGLEKLILEDCIRLVQIHESIGDLQKLLILNLRNCTSLMELPEEMSRLNSLRELVLDGCSNLDSLMNMVLEHHQGSNLLQSDGIVASASYITSLLLKLFFPSRFSARKMLRFTSFSLPRSLTRLDLSGTTMRSLPESIKDLGLLRYLCLRNCKMLLALPEVPSHLSMLDVSFCNSLQRLANGIHLTVADGCDQIFELQDWIKQELIQKFDSHVFRIMEIVSGQIRPSRFQILVMDGVFNVVAYVFDEEEKSRWFHEEEEEDEWLILNGFVNNFSFKLSSPVTRRICGFNLFTRFRMSVSSEWSVASVVTIEIRNRTNQLRCQASFFVSHRPGVREFQSLSHTKLGVGDPTFDNGDVVSISVLPQSPAVQVKTIGVQWLHEEEGKDEVINAHNSSDDAHAAKVEIASRIFRDYYCGFYECEEPWGYFAKKGLELVII